METNVKDIFFLVKVCSLLNNNKDELPEFCLTFLEELQQYIENTCVHNWVDDNIDTCQGESSVNIRYCSKCYNITDP